MSSDPHFIQWQICLATVAFKPLSHQRWTRNLYLSRKKGLFSIAVSLKVTCAFMLQRHGWNHSRIKHLSDRRERQYMPYVVTQTKVIRTPGCIGHATLLFQEGSLEMTSIDSLHSIRK